MGKRQHQKDKMYLTCTEWSNLYGGKKPVAKKGAEAEFRRLPFDHCSLSLLPFEHPLCSPEGHIFDLMYILPFLKKYGINPVTGKPLSPKALIKLNFHKNADGQYHCPVMYKVINNNSNIVCISTTGNVFSQEAVEELNIKNKNFKDLLTDEPFSRTDIIVIQDPSDLDKFNLATFHHLKNNLKVDDEDEKARKDPKYFLKSVNKETEVILAELEKEYKTPDKTADTTKKVADKFNAAHYSTGAVAAGFTSTTMAPMTDHEAAVMDDDTVLYARVKKKGYVRLQTNHGILNLELHCDMVPKACDNFLKLCQKGYYDGTVFHRSIRNFMIQGGDPTATGKGGESIWEKPFKDEFKPNLIHAGRGVLSMANSGPNTNKSQFFITYRSCRHLDNKHTVFGRVVGGLDTLNIIEKIETDEKDRPLEEIKIERTLVFVDPFQEAAEQLVKDREEQKEKEVKLADLSKPSTSQNSSPKVFKAGIGKYINNTASKPEEAADLPVKKKKLIDNVVFKDFSCW